MRLKDLPKEVRNPDGELFGTLVIGGREEFEHNGKKVMVKRLYYKGVGSMENRDFTTSESDTLWLAYFGEAWIQQGGKLTDIKAWAGLYKNYKFNRPGSFMKKRAREWPDHFPQGKKRLEKLNRLEGLKKRG